MSGSPVIAGRLRTYDRRTSAVFLKTAEAWGGLSNMAPGFPLEVNGVAIRTAEALYQACRFPHLPHVQRLIIQERSPMTAKMRGKPYRCQSRPDWDSARINIMRWTLRVKLALNWRSFGTLLLQTGDLPIVEHSRKDEFWGAKPDGEFGLCGRNVLGRLLMELRLQLRAQPESLLMINPPPLSDFRLYEEQIRPIASNQAEADSDQEEDLYRRLA